MRRTQVHGTLTQAPALARADDLRLREELRAQHDVGWKVSWSARRAMRHRSAVMGGAPFRRRFLRASIDHFVQVMRGSFYVKVFVLTRSAFGANHSTTVNILEITIGELIPSFGVFGLLVVDTQMPFAVFFKSMPLDEGIFLLRGRLVLAPCVPFIEHEFSVIDEFLGVVEGSPVEFHGHDPDSSSHSGLRCFHMFVVGMMLALAPHPAKRRASRFRIERSPKDQWAR